jgi:hypothetical protein
MITCQVQEHDHMSAHHAASAWCRSASAIPWQQNAFKLQEPFCAGAVGLKRVTVLTDGPPYVFPLFCPLQDHRALTAQGRAAGPGP